MRKRRIRSAAGLVALLVGLVTIPLGHRDPQVVPAPPEGRREAVAPDASGLVGAQPLRLSWSDLQPVASPAQIASLPTFGAFAVKIVRRFSPARLHALVLPSAIDESLATRATALRLREATDCRAARVLVERSLRGAASFHTNTPPPPTLV